MILVLLIMTVKSQSQNNFAWGKQFGTDKEEYVRNFVTDKSGNIYVSGNTAGIMNDKNFGKNDGFISKIDCYGNLIWSVQFGSDGNEDVQWSAIDNFDNIYVTGNTTGVLSNKSYGKEDFFLIKFSADGQKIWTKQFGTDSMDIVLGIFIDREGYVYLAGSTSGILGKSTSGNEDGFIMKLDSNGTLAYTNQFGTTTRDGCSAITGDNNGNIFVAGTTFGDLGGKNKGFIDGFTGQFTEKGELIKFFQFGSEGFDMPTCILVDDDKNIYMGGTTSGNLAAPQLGEGDCFLTKTGINGNILWCNQFGTQKHDGIKGIAFNPTSSDYLLVSGLLNLHPAHAFVKLFK